jgi:hypothetical protein
MARRRHQLEAREERRLLLDQWLHTRLAAGRFRAYPSYKTLYLLRTSSQLITGHCEVLRFLKQESIGPAPSGVCNRGVVRDLRVHTQTQMQASAFHSYI